jgi:hypothetical protein
MHQGSSLSQSCHQQLECLRSSPSCSVALPMAAAAAAATGRPQVTWPKGGARARERKLSLVATSNAQPVKMSTSATACLFRLPAHPPGLLFLLRGGVAALRALAGGATPRGKAKATPPRHGTADTGRNWCSCCQNCPPLRHSAAKSWRLCCSNATLARRATRGERPHNNAQHSIG